MSKMFRYIFSSILLLGSIVSYSQTTDGLVGFFNFQNCEVRDVTGNNTDITTGLPPFCECGIRTDALEFDGANQFIHMGAEANLNDLFTRATFSVSFYFRPLVNSGNMVLLSKRESCAAPRGFAVYYNAQTRQMVIETAESATILSRLTRTLPADRCWHQVVITRIGTTLRLYVNNQLLGEERSTSVVNMTNEGPIQVGTGVCVGATAVPFNGLMSDLRFYSRDIQSLDIAGLFLNQDKFFNRDTTIFLSSSVQINPGANCTDNIIWNPPGDLNNPSIDRPLITPNADQTYIMTLNYGNCVARDTINITVIDPSEIDCAEMPMANIFTPNSDGLNDNYGISNPFSMETLIAFEIFDRNGGKVFSTNNQFDNWDGSFNGKPMPPGAYLFMVKYLCNGQELIKSGSFHLMR